MIAAAIETSRDTNVIPFGPVRARQHDGDTAVDGVEPRLHPGRARLELRLHHGSEVGDPAERAVLSPERSVHV